MSDGPMMIMLLVAGIALVLAVIVLSARKRRARRSAELREHFGPEYHRALEEHGDQERAERELLARKRRLDDLDIVLLSPEQCDTFSAAWAEVQLRFVDDPRGAVHEADILVKDVMKARGYPMGNFEQRVADLSVKHANVVDHYRAARSIATASASGQAETEDLRQAMVHYRALFHDLLQSHAPAQPPALRQAHA